MLAIGVASFIYWIINLNKWCYFGNVLDILDAGKCQGKRVTLYRIKTDSGVNINMNNALGIVETFNERFGTSARLIDSLEAYLWLRMEWSEKLALYRNRGLGSGFEGKEFEHVTAYYMFAHTLFRREKNAFIWIDCSGTIQVKDMGKFFAHYGVIVSMQESDIVKIHQKLEWEKVIQKQAI